MKTNTLLALSLVAVGTLFASSAQAGGSLGITVYAPVRHTVPVFGPVHSYCPPPRVVCPPPRPYCPPVVYVPPYYHGGYRHDCDRFDRHGHGWGRGGRDERHDGHNHGHGYDGRDGRGNWHGGRR